MAWLFATLWGGGQYVSLYLTMRVYATIGDSHAPHDHHWLLQEAFGFQFKNVKLLCGAPSLFLSLSPVVS